MGKSIKSKHADTAPYRAIVDLFTGAINWDVVDNLSNEDIDALTQAVPTFDLDDEGWELCPKYGARILPDDDGSCSLCGAPWEHGLSS